MRVRLDAFRLHKRGNQPDEYEDACWPEEKIVLTTSAFRAAVADGATETSFSGCWAEALVRAWCRGQLDSRRLDRTVPSLQREWFARVSARPLPWYAEEKIRSGAFSSLLGFAAREGQRERDRRWEVLAIGDSCIFQVRQEQLLQVLPLARTHAFSNRPHLLSTNPAANGKVLKDRIRFRGTWRPADVFYLATDACARYLLAQVEAGRNPWDAIERIRLEGGQDEFVRWVSALREDGVMRNDDVTLSCLTLS